MSIPTVEVHKYARGRAHVSTVWREHDRDHVYSGDGTDVKAKKFIESVFSQREGGTLAPLETAEILNAAFAEAHGAGILQYQFQT